MPKKRKIDHYYSPQDEATQQTVHDLLAILQSYGPLTLGQLEYNLPTHRQLPQIIEILVAVGWIPKIAPDRYAMVRGIPREEENHIPTHLGTLQAEIQRAHAQANASWRRSQILVKALKNPNEPATQTLAKLMAAYPELKQDPVYATAQLCASQDTANRKVVVKRPAATASTAAAAPPATVTTATPGTTTVVPAATSESLQS